MTAVCFLFFIFAEKSGEQHPIFLLFMLKPLTSFCLLLFLIACGTAEQAERRGEAAFHLGEYAEAAAQFRLAYQRTPLKEKVQRGRRAYLMANAYRRYGNTARSLANYRTAERYQYHDSLLSFHIGEGQRIIGAYKEAQQSYERQLSITPHHHLSAIGLQAAKEAQQGATSSDYTAKLAQLFNGSRSDFSPAFLGTQAEQLYFTTTRRQAQGKEPSGITGIMAGDIWFSKKDEKGNWKAPVAVEGGINSDYDEGACAFSPDGRTMYLTICRTDPVYPRMAEIWTSQRSEATWSKPQPLKITNDSLSSYAHPAISPDGRWLYFTSDMPGGLGGYDLWRASLTPKGVGAIENLGSSINTEGNELFPTFRHTGELFFSSDGRGGKGGLDIYKGQLDSLSGSWFIFSLPAPINSQGDDFGLTFEGTKPQGYFSSNRATGGRGWDKLYAFTFPTHTLQLKGWVYEQDGYELPGAQVHIVGTDGTNTKVSALSDGSFDYEIREGVSYAFLASHTGYLNVRGFLPKDSTSQGQKSYTLQFPLPSMNIPVLVRNVFYAFDKAELTERSTEALNRLATLLKENPHIVIELSAHTDSRGRATYNQVLSQRRAESVVQYLTQQGIASHRLVAKGYGLSRPLVVSKKLAAEYDFLQPKDTLHEAYIAKLPAEQQEICHGLNRRTEFRVLRTLVPTATPGIDTANKP